jgi:hypothetical protein
MQGIRNTLKIRTGRQCEIVSAPPDQSDANKYVEFSKSVSISVIFPFIKMKFLNDIAHQ